MITIFVQGFLAALLAEFKLDRTVCAGASLTARYPLKPVAVGVILALTLKMVLAALLGELLLSLLPHQTWETLSRALTVGIFVMTAFLLLYRVNKDSSQTQPPPEPPAANRSSYFRVVATSFAVMFFTEWFDRSQLLIMSIAADGARTIGFAGVVAAGCGGALALIVREALALFIGARLSRVIAPRLLRCIAALLCIALAVWTLIKREEGERDIQSPPPNVSRTNVQ